MGVDFRDYDNDGRPDIVVTDLAKQVYALFHNDGNGMFSYRSMETGLGVLTAGSSGWGMRLEDLDNGRLERLIRGPKPCYGQRGDPQPITPLLASSAASFQP